MTEEHPPITPPLALVEQWVSDFFGAPLTPGEGSIDLATRAAQWGADQELEACCALLELSDNNARDFLQSARRPKPPSLKEQALLALNKLPPNRDCGVAHDTIRRALEQLDD